MVVAAAAAAASVFAVCVRVFVEAQRTCGVPAAIKTTTAPVIVADRLGPAHRCGATTDEAAAAAHGVTVIGIAVGVRGVTATETTAAAAVAAAVAVATEGTGGTGGGDRCMRGRVCAACEARQRLGPRAFHCSFRKHNRPSGGHAQGGVGHYQANCLMRTRHVHTVTA